MKRKHIGTKKGWRWGWVMNFEKNEENETGVRATLRFCLQLLYYTHILYRESFSRNTYKIFRRLLTSLSI